MGRIFLGFDRAVFGGIDLGSGRVVFGEIGLGFGKIALSFGKRCDGKTVRRLPANKSVRLNAFICSLEGTAFRYISLDGLFFIRPEFVLDEEARTVFLLDSFFDLEDSAKGRCAEVEVSDAPVVLSGLTVLLRIFFSALSCSSLEKGLPEIGEPVPVSCTSMSEYILKMMSLS